MGISLEINLNTFKCLTASFSTEILILAIAPLSFTSVGSIFELAMLPDVHILQSPQKEEVHPSS